MADEQSKRQPSESDLEVINMAAGILKSRTMKYEISDDGVSVWARSSKERPLRDALGLMRNLADAYDIIRDNAASRGYDVSYLVAGTHDKLTFRKKIT